MGFDLIGDKVLIVENDSSGVVRKDRNADVVFASGFADFLGGAFDVVFIQAVFHVIYGRGENSVFAVFRPCLGEGFDLNVFGGASEFFEVVLYGLHIGQRQAERAAAGAIGVLDAVAADGFEFVVRDVQIDVVGNCPCMVEGDFGDDGVHAAVAFEFLYAFDGGALDQFVGQAGGQFFNVVFC